MPDKKDDLDTAGRYLTALSAELAARGLKSELIRSGFRPRLRLYFEGMVTGFEDAPFEDNVIVSPCATGELWYWDPFIEKIAPADDAVKAAEMIAPSGDGEHDDAHAALQPMATQRR